MTLVGPHPTDVHVGARLRAFRKRVGVSQVELASGMKLTFQQVQKYERGDNRISASKLLEAARILGVRISDFFDGLEPEGDGRERDEAAGPVDPKVMRIAHQLAALKNPRAREQITTLIEVLAQE